MTHAPETLEAMAVRHSLERLDALGLDEVAVLTRYGRPEAIVTGRDALARFHSLQGQSTDYAIRHAGWAVVPQTIHGVGPDGHDLDNSSHTRGLIAWHDAIGSMRTGGSLHRLDRFGGYAVRALEALHTLTHGPDLDPYAGAHILEPAMLAATASLDYVGGALEGARGDMSEHIAYCGDMHGVTL